MSPLEVEKLVGDLEVAVDRLRALYEQYFMGFEKLEPLVPRKDVDRKIHALRKEQIRNTAQRFRFQMLLQRYSTYQTHWQRILREIDNGTYRRHLARAAKRFGPEGAGTMRAPVGPQPGAPVTDPTIAKALAELDLDFAPAAKPVRHDRPPLVERSAKAAQPPQVANIASAPSQVLPARAPGNAPPPHGPPPRPPPPRPAPPARPHAAPNPLASGPVVPRVVTASTVVNAAPPLPNKAPAQLDAKAAPAANPPQKPSLPPPPRPAPRPAGQPPPLPPARPKK